MLVVAALGGNALLRRGEPADAVMQRRTIESAVNALTEVADEHQLIVTHGNGPQVGLLALQSEADGAGRPYPLDVLGAGSEGMIGYLLEQGLESRLGYGRAATLLTQVVVDPRDPAFETPTTFVGPVYEHDEAERLALARGWRVARDGAKWRRVVPSPEPQRIVELEAIATLVAADLVVICVGGGGVPVVVDDHGGLHGVEAVIDKDLAAALLACELGADALLLLTDVDAVQTGWGTPAARELRSVRAADVPGLALPAGSLGPKAVAAARFATGIGGIAAIGALTDVRAILDGRAGTRVVPDHRSSLVSLEHHEAIR